MSAPSLVLIDTTENLYKLYKGKRCVLKTKALVPLTAEDIETFRTNPYILLGEPEPEMA